MNSRRIALSLLAGGLVVATAGVGSAQDQSTKCTWATPMPATHVNVVVPEGATCNLSDSTVLGSVFVKPGGALCAGEDECDSMTAMTEGGVVINGNLQADSPRWIELRQSRLDDNVQIVGTQSSPGMFGMQPNLICDDSRIGGNISFIESSEDAPWRLGEDEVDMGAASDCEDSVLVEGNTSFKGNDALIEVFRNRPLPDRGFLGNVSFTDNTGGVEVHDNDIEGSLFCRGNEPPANSSGNAADRFEGECQA